VPNKIQNGDFSAGFQSWVNPTGGASEFTLDSGKAKAISSATSSSGVEHSMRQEFSNYGYALSAKIWVWGQWSVPSGGSANGSCNFRVRLVDPLGGSHTLLNTTKTPGSGSGWLLENYDILDKFASYGLFNLKLDCTPASARDTTYSGVANPYTSWTKGGGPWYPAGGYHAEMYDSDNKWRVIGDPDSDAEREAWTEKTLVVGGATYDSKVSVSVKGRKSINPAAKAHGKVVLVKPDSSEVTLWDGEYSDDDWHQVLSNYDITAHVQQTGTYKLRLYAAVKSYYTGAYWYQSFFHFNDISLTANWYTYTQTTGWYDNISLILLCKYYKTVKEDLGAGESKTKKAMLSEKEDAGLSESYETLKSKPKTVAESLGLKEFTFKKALKTVKEDLGMIESFFAPDFFTEAKEDVGLAETYLAQRRVPGAASEGVGLGERLFARLIRGNIVIDYDLTTKTEWDEVPKTETAWIKTKTTVT
jgi:hypothetical protein